MLRFGGRRGCRGVQLLRMGWLVQSPLTMRIGANTSARDWRRSGSLAWNGLLPFEGYMAGSGASSLHDYFDYQARVIELWLFSTDPSLVRVQVYHYFHSVLRYCLTLLLKLDLQFELQPLHIILLFSFGRASALLWWRFTGTGRTSLKFCRLLSTKLSSPLDLSVASMCGTRVSRGIRDFRTSPIVADSGGTSLRVHLGYLLASGPALILALHLPMKCGSCMPGLEFRCRIVSREKGIA